MRRWGKRHGERDEGLWWPIQSRNKKSVTLNLRTSEGQDLFRKLVEKADVIVENFRPGTMERWGLGYDALSEINPKLIMARTSGFGQTGPYRDRAGFGSVGEAMGGLRYITGFPDRPPSRIGISIGDSLAAVFATIGVLNALYERTKSGRGQVVDTAIYEAVFSVMESVVPDYLMVDYVRERMGNILPGVAPSNIYPTKDETYVVIGANADTVFARLAEAMGEPELAEDPKYRDHHARAAHMAELDERIAEWTKTLTSEVLLATLEHHGVPSGLIYSAEDIVNDPHYRAREMIIEVPHGEYGKFPMPGVVPKLSRTPGEVKFAGSLHLGQHNEEVYTRLLGLEPAELNTLRESRVI